ncbi:hypothetical protein [Peribacillus sp. SI8-4]|nr:hypothetical protein [Peribacillus sp. SI8-4]
MEFFKVLKDTRAKGEFGEEMTITELVGELNDKLSKIIEESDGV